MVMLSIAANSQVKEFVIQHCVETKTFSTSELLICSNESRTKWFAIQPTYEPNSYYPMNKGFKVFKLGIGDKDTEDLLVFTFFDDSITVVKSVGDINSDQSINFELTAINLEALRTKTVMKIRFINVTQSESYTYECKDNDGSFFTNGFTNITIKKIKCK
jgi:hypothetical protein